jgi:glutamate formiminotransferase
VGALDVCPFVWTSEEDQEPAREQALSVAKAIAEVEVPVFLYGELASADERRERAYFRSGGLSALAARMGRREVLPDFGPGTPHPTAGVTLITARPPLAAFNVLLEGAGMEAARHVASSLRESGGGLPGVRAIAVNLGEAGAQVSTNIHDPIAVPLRTVVERIAELAAEKGAQPGAAEIVGLVPEAALAGFPAELAVPGFVPDLHVLERRL